MEKFQNSIIFFGEAVLFGFGMASDNYLFAILAPAIVAGAYFGLKELLKRKSEKLTWIATLLCVLLVALGVAYIIYKL